MKAGDVCNYSDCSFEVRLKKKTMFSYSLRYVYFAPDRMIVCTIAIWAQSRSFRIEEQYSTRASLRVIDVVVYGWEQKPYQPKPEKIVQLHLRMSVKWIYDSTKMSLPFKERAKGFMILNEKEEIVAELHGDSMVMVPMQEFFCKQIFQTEFIQEFDIISKIGKGKYAKVYKVKRKDTGEYFAVKYLHKRKMKEIDDSDAALDNELNILRVLNHPNCLRMVGVYQDNDGYYILTELLDEKKSLSQEIAKYRNPQFSYRMVKHILQQLLRGLEYIHAKGIMHRDLKPQNIMFCESQSGTLSQLKLIDFGLAQVIAQRKYIYVHVGTPGYVAPEILANESENHRYDEKCDLFSIGVIFHTLLTGKTVFPGNKFSQVLEKNKLCQIQLTGTRYEEVNRDAIDLLAKMLMKDPRKRISAADALNHKFFLEKGADLDKMPTFVETGNGAAISPTLGIPSPQTIQLNRGDLKAGTIAGTGIGTNGQTGQLLKKRPAKTLNAIPEPSNMLNRSISSGTVFNQLASLKSMKDIDDTTPQTIPTQTEAVYRFTRDLLGLLANLQENKEYLQNDDHEYDDYSPTKLKGNPSTQRFDLSNSGVKANELKINNENRNGNDTKEENEINKKDTNNKEQQLGEADNPSPGKLNRKALFINTNMSENRAKASPQKGGAYIDTELTNRKEYRGKVSMEQPTQNNPEDEEVDHNDDDDFMNNDEDENNFNHTIDLEKKARKFEQDSPSPQEQGNLQGGLKLNLPRLPFAAKNNMILNEISSPVSPPPQYSKNKQAQEGQQGVRPPLRLRIERVPFSPSSLSVSPMNGIQDTQNEAVTNKGNVQEEKDLQRVSSKQTDEKKFETQNQELKKEEQSNQQGKTEKKEVLHLKYPKEIIQLIEYFPQDMFSCYLHRNQEEIEKGMARRVFKLGIFLLFGHELDQIPTQKEILAQIKEISTKKYFNTWFIEMIKTMVDQNEEMRPTLSQLSNIFIEKYPQHSYAQAQ